MKKTCIASVLALLLLWLSTFCSLAGPAYAAQTTGLGWDPQHVKIFVVGVLKWKSKDLDAFSVHNRRDQELVQQFTQLGVPSNKLVYLANEKATLQAIKSGLTTSLQGCQSDDTFIFYYCGHGWLDDDDGRGYFANYDAGDDSKTCLAVDDIVKIFKANFKGSKALFLADCCRSGSLSDALQASKCGLKYGALSASTAGEDSTGNWTFTQAVVDSFAGHNYADTNGDGVITFTELGSYVKEEMKLLEGQVASVVSGDGFDSQMKIANVVFKQEAVPERVEVKFEGDWWKAKLLERREQKGRIHWLEIGWDAPEDDVWVPISDVRPLRGGATAGAQTKVNSTSVTVAPKLEVKQKVTVLWEGEYYPAVIQNVDGSRYFVHYDEYDQSNDEWVGLDRIKVKSNAASQPSPRVESAKFSLNQKVSVLSEGDYYPAVIRKINGNKYLVHYDGYDASDDEWVGADKIKLKK
ncbi:MAG: caspase family protein [Cyanobacteria bacterium]|nr:caspase family protein [Cyanobacteriota bacterium]